MSNIKKVNCIKIGRRKDIAKYIFQLNMSGSKNKLFKGNILFAMKSSFIIGLLFHMYYIVNGFPNKDVVLGGIFQKYYQGWNLSIGRWATYYVDGFNSYFLLPWLDGAMAIFFLAISTAIIVDILEIESKVNIIIIGAIMMGYKSIFATLTYINAGDLFLFSLLLSVVGVWCLERLSIKIAIPLSIITLAISIGIYQSYITMSISFCLLILIKDLLNPKSSIGQVVSKAGRFLLYGLSGTIVYYVILKILLEYSGISISGYKGFGKFNNYYPIQILRNSINSLKSFYEVWFTDAIFTNGISFIIASIVIFIVTVLMMLGLFKIRKNQKKTVLLLLIICFFVLYLSYGMMEILGPEAGFSILTITNNVFFIITPVMLLESLGMDVKSIFMHKKTIRWIIVISVFIIVKSNVIEGNLIYLNLKMQFEKTTYRLTEIMTRIRELDYYEKDKKIFIVGNIMGANNHTLNPELKKGIKGHGPLIEDDTAIYGHDMRAKQSFIYDYFGEAILIPDSKQQEEILNSNEFMEMALFPHSKSIKLIEDVIVVKME